MSKQPEALRLADLLANDPCSKAHHDAAAAELRRLQARLAASEDQAERAVAGCERLRAQRDALLAALKELTGHVNERFTGGVWDRARAAIKAVEEGK